MTALTTLTRTQSKVFLREPVVVVFGVVFPAVLLLVIGTVFPGATKVNAELGNQSLVEIYAPTTAVMALLTLGIAMLPQALGLDRERGILRRLSATPAHPRLLVTAHVTVQAIAVIVATVAAVVVGALVFDLGVPSSLGWFVLSFVLAATALLSIGVLIGALVPTAQAGSGMGMLLYFPMLFFAGVYLPLEIMPQGLRTVTGWTPPGATADDPRAAAGVGSTPSTTSLLVLLATALVAGGLATRFFRWE
jgi:ABC-2 type transport system permease protein